MSCWECYLSNALSGAEPLQFTPLMFHICQPHLATAAARSPVCHEAGRTSNTRVAEGVPQLPCGAAPRRRHASRAAPAPRVSARSLQPGWAASSVVPCDAAAASFGRERRLRHYRGLALERGQSFISACRDCPMPALVGAQGQRWWLQSLLGR